MSLVKIHNPHSNLNQGILTTKTKQSNNNNNKSDRYDYEKDIITNQNEKYNRFLDPKEMTTFPRFDDGFYSPITKLNRNTPLSPYKGYFSDVKLVEKTMKEEPSHNLINTYLSQSFSQTNDINNNNLNNLYTNQSITSFVETNVIRRHITFKERMADKLYKRHSRRLCKRIFEEWYKYSFRYVILRRNLLTCYNMRYISRRFYAWRYIARLSVCFRKCLKIYWKRVRKLHFRWWKIWTEWVITKEKICRETFNRIRQHTLYQLKIREYWIYFIREYYKDHSIRLIQRVYRWHRLRKFYWANRVIKKLFMDYFIIWLIRRRKRKEKKRKIQEDLAVQQMVDRSDLYLRKYLQCRDGKAMAWTYIKEVNTLWDDKKSRPNLFPSKEDMPEIGMKWTVRGKAMHILRHRTIEEVSDWARAQFRSSCPPLYLCPRCGEVFVLKVIAREHKVNCQFVKEIPQYTCWKLCEGIVDASLKPLVALFYGKEAAARAQRKEMEEIQRKQSDKLLHEALTGTPIRPEYEEVQTKPRKTDLRVF